MNKMTTHEFLNTDLDVDLKLKLDNFGSSLPASVRSQLNGFLHLLSDPAKVRASVNVDADGAVWLVVVGPGVDAEDEAESA